MLNHYAIWNPYLERGLLTVREWSRLVDLSFYREAFRIGALEVRPENPTNKRPAKCDICRHWHEKGTLNRFWFAHGYSSWWFKVCDECLKKVKA